METTPDAMLPDTKILKEPILKLISRTQDHRKAGLIPVQEIYLIMKPYSISTCSLSFKESTEMVLAPLNPPKNIGSLLVIIMLTLMRP